MAPINVFEQIILDDLSCGNLSDEQLHGEQDDGAQVTLKTKRPEQTSTIRATTALESVAFRQHIVVSAAGDNVTDLATGESTIFAFPTRTCVS